MSILGHLPSGLARLSGGVGVQLLVNGMLYEGWKSVQIQRGVKQMAGQFTLLVSERWTAGQGGPPSLLSWRIRPGDSCTLLYYGVPAVTGYVDAYNPSYDAKSHDVTIQGRSKTADLCDCSSEREDGEWSDADVPQIATDLAHKFGVGVKIEGFPGSPFSKARIEQGERVQETVERYARQRGLWPTDDARGNLVLKQVSGGGQFQLVEGVNILKAQATLRADSRHSKISLKGQRPGSDEVYGPDAAEIYAEATDTAVKRYRPLVIIGEGATDKETANERVDQEGAARAGESVKATVTVQDWWQSPGTLWTPGAVGLLKAPMLAINKDMAIESVTLNLDQGGTVAELSLVGPEALNSKSQGGGAAGETDESWTATRPGRAQ